jgi:hypothetical protein
MPLEHWMMFSTFAEQDYFIYPRKDVYSGVIINANMAAHAPAGLASFIMGKLDTDTKYIIDPITHAFQHDPALVRNEKGEVKTSIRVLTEEYGTWISTLAGYKPILPSDLAKREMADFTMRVLDFQRNHLSSYMEQSDAAKYLEEAEIKKPDALVAPYFYITETEWSDWLEKNLDCVEKASSFLASGERLFAEIVVDRGVLLDQDIRRRIMEGYRRVGAILAGCLIWIDNFDEQEVPVAELRAMKQFCADLKTFMPEVINLHGGYFSIMLGGSVGGNCLTGVTHGPEFGEFRSVVPVGGGIPIARYYVPRLHSRVRYREAADVFRSAGWLDSSDQFLKNVCDCEECRTTLDGDADNFTKFGEGEVKNVRRGRGMASIEFPYSATKIRCLKHYLQRKHREYQMIRKAEPKQTLEELKDSISVYREYVGNDGVAHLMRWRTVLSPTTTTA